MIPPEYMNQIVTGDARELAKRIPDESVDLIFTDPVYDRIEDYEWLAGVAMRVLKPGGAVLVWSNGNWHKRNVDWLEGAGLSYRWDFACVKAGVNVGGFCGKVMLRANRLIWLDGKHRSTMKRSLIDGFIGIPIPKLGSNHRWTKDPQYCQMALRAFSTVGDVVYDPFAGGGTIPALCKMTSRNFIASEIDPDTAQKARERVAMTQVPLFVLTEEQATMEIA